MHQANVFEKLSKKSGIQGVPQSMLGTAKININRHPGFYMFLIKDLVFILWIQISVHVPRIIKKSVHSLRLPLCITTAFRARNFHPYIICCQRRLALRPKISLVRKLNRQIFLRNRYRTTFRAVDNRNRRSPISLTRNRPVVQVILNLALAKTSLLYIVEHFSLCLFAGHIVKMARIKKYRSVRVLSFYLLIIPETVTINFGD